MGTRLQVDPAQLLSAASRIDSQASEYRRLYNRLYGDVGTMQAAWKGPDNLGFTNEIEGFRSDFELMAATLEEYSAQLKARARRFQQALDDSVADTHRL